MPGSVLIDYRVKFVSCVVSDCDPEGTDQPNEKNAFDVLMTLKKTYSWIPPEKYVDLWCV